MNSLKNRVENAKSIHINYRRKALTDDSDRTDDSFFDFSDPVDLEHFDADHQDEIHHVIHNYLQVPGYRKLDEKSARSFSLTLHQNETFLAASKFFEG